MSTDPHSTPMSSNHEYLDLPAGGTTQSRSERTVRALVELKLGGERERTERASI